MNKRNLFYLTRRVDFLWKSALILAAVIVVLGGAISFLNTGRQDSFEHIMAMPRYVDELYETLDEFGAEQSNHEVVAEAISKKLASTGPFHEKLIDIQGLIDFLTGGELIEIPSSEDLSGLSPAEYEITVAFIAASSHLHDEKPLIALAAAEPPLPNANYALALIFRNKSNDCAVINALKKEIEFHDSEHARERLVGTYLGTKNFTELEQLKSDPGFAPLITNYVLLEIALAKMDWAAIIKTHFFAVYEQTNIAMVVLALLSGLIWAIILARFNGSPSILKLAIPALLLGALSTHGTLLVIYWQEYQLGFTIGTEMVDQLVYCLFGIGLREEALKLLFFIPLIPFLLKRNDLEILTIAGLVGLGFAIEENINYFESTAGLSALGRFATANFLHIALTAMCGLTFTRAIIHKGEEIQQAAIMFGTVVVIHGLYDAFIMVPMLQDYSFLSLTIFILMGYQYFGWLRHLRDNWSDPISITSTFTYGIILVTGISFGLFAWNSGLLPALRAIAHEAIGVGIILILFYREIPEAVE